MGLFTPKYPKSDTPNATGTPTRRKSSDSNDNDIYASLSAYDPTVEAAKALDAADTANRRGDTAARDRHTDNAQKHLNAAKRRY